MKCKYCGAAVHLDSHDITRFDCGTELHDNGTPDERWYWTMDCADTLRERFDAAPTYWGALDDLGRLQWCTSNISAIASGAQPVLCRLVPVEGVK